MHPTTIFTILTSLIMGSTLTTAKLISCVADTPDSWSCSESCHIGWPEEAPYGKCMGILEGTPPEELCCCDGNCARRSCRRPFSGLLASFMQNSTSVAPEPVDWKDLAVSSRRGRLSRQGVEPQGACPDRRRRLSRQAVDPNSAFSQECCDWLYYGKVPA